MLAMVLSMCSRPATDALNEGIVFRYNEAAGISSLDPAFSSNIENIWAINMLYNGLVQMDENMMVQPCIAHSWGISDDKKVYTFYLREDVFFHNSEVFPEGEGRKVVANDFLRSFLRLVDPNTASPGSYIFNNIDRNAENDWLGFQVVDDFTFRIWLKEPNPSFLGLLTMQYCSVVPDEAVEYYGLDFRRNPVGTGPFMFTKWKEGIKLILTKNPMYFEMDADGNQLPYLDGVAISFTRDRYIAFIEFLNGKFDFMSGLDKSYRDVLLDGNGALKADYEGKCILDKHDWLKTDYLGFLMQPAEGQEAIFDDANLRLAINYGLNREDMVLRLRNNLGIPATAGFLPPGFPGYEHMKVEGFSYSPEKAQEYLEASDYEESGSPVVMLKTTADYLELVESIQFDLEEIGINTKIDILDASVYRSQVANSHIDFFRKSWLADYSDPMNFLQLFYSANFCPDGPNYTHFSNTQYDALFEQAKSEANNEVRLDLFRQMDSILVAEAPIAPLYYDQSIRFIQPNVSGLLNNSMNLLNLKEVRVAR